MVSTYSIEHNYGSIRGYPSCNGKNHSSFKKKPRLNINRIESYPIDITAYRRKQNDEVVDQKKFNAKIWVLEVRNTGPSLISTSARECSSTLHFKNVGADIPLRWRTHKPEPNECIVNEIPREGEPFDAPYHRLMPYYYAVEKLAGNHAATIMTIEVGEVYNLYLLFTYEGSDHAFIITPLEQPQWYGNNELFYPSPHGVFLFLEGGQEYEIRIAFKSNTKIKNNPDIKDINLKIKFISWDKVEIM